jgi:ABC-type amino acid transport system permease subunit
MAHNKNVEIEKKENLYLSKSIKIYKVYWACLLISLLTVIIIKPLFKESNLILDFLIGVPVIVLIILALFGLYYSLRSYKERESHSSTQFKYFIGHLIFTLFAIFFAYSVYIDFKQ